MAMKQGMNVPMILTVGISSVLLLVSSIIAMEAWFHVVEDQTIAEGYATAPILPLDDIRAKQDSHLQTYAIVDKDKDIYAITIDDAIKVLAKSGGVMPSTQPAR